jgi:uncharacterized protein
MLPSESGYKWLKRQADDLLASSADIEGVMILLPDGEIIYSNFPKIFDKPQLKRLGTYSAVAASLGVSLIDGMSQYQWSDTVYCKCDHGYLIILPLRKYFVLVVLAREQAKLGLIFLDIGRGFIAPSLEPIFPTHPLGYLSARAVPEYDDEE